MGPGAWQASTEEHSHVQLQVPHTLLAACSAEQSSGFDAQQEALSEASPWPHTGPGQGKGQLQMYDFSTSTVQVHWREQAKVGGGVCECGRVCLGGGWGEGGNISARKYPLKMETW